MIERSKAGRKAHRILFSPPRRGRHSELLYIVHELSRLISTYFDQAVAKHGLTHSQWWAMMHIYEHEGATQSELAAIMQLGRASTGRTLERLETKGWIERRDDAEDNRLRRVFLTDGSDRYFAMVHKEAMALFRDFLAGVGPREEDTLFQGLSRIKANAERRLRVTERESTPRARTSARGRPA